MLGSGIRSDMEIFELLTPLGISEISKIKCTCDIAFLNLVRYIFKTKRLGIQNLGVPQLHGKRYIESFIM